MITSQYPLVSIPVITYNSSKYITDALDSIYNQTYGNIELIISDDCSSDDTVFICQDWLSKHGSRFSRTLLLTSEVNTGISSNLNRAENECTGELVKFLAGDDMLVPEAITEYVNFASTHPDDNFFFSNIIVIGSTDENNTKLESVFLERNRQLMELASNEKQFVQILKRETPPAVTYCYRREVYLKLGIKNDEDIRLLEDFPKWINILRKGEHLAFIEKPLVIYRVGGLSTSKAWYSKEMFVDKRKIDLKYVFVEKYKTNPEEAIQEILDFEIDLYNSYLHELSITDKIRHTLAYRLFRFLRLRK